VQHKQYQAAHAALIGIGPKDELEGMMAAQLIAAHSASMECYRRAMIPEQTFQGRQENLSQASKLSRTFATLLEALNRHRGKGVSGRRPFVKGLVSALRTLRCGHVFGLT
jgi:hypothetical protein